MAEPTVITVRSCNSCPFLRETPHEANCNNPRMAGQSWEETLLGTLHERFSGVPEWCPLLKYPVTFQAKPY